jgi:subtilisin family serine protease
MKYLFFFFCFVCLALSSNIRKWAVEFNSSSVIVEEFAVRYGLKYAGTVGVLENVHLFTMESDNNKKRDLHFQFFDDLKRSEKADQSDSFIKWHEEQNLKKREKRYEVKDPLYHNQWHLHEKPAHVNVQEVWDKGIFGKGIRIAIVDDGIQTTHPDVKENVRLDSSYNFNRDIESPDPTYKSGPSGDWHGTASAGTAAARDDGVSCGVGAAPHAELAGIAILQNNADVSDEIEAKALSYRFDLNHIYSNSWGPIRPGSSGHKNEAPGTLAAKAIKKAIEEGRNGLGSIYVWAAGNDGSSGDNCNYDGYANMRYTVLIGSSDSTGSKPGYSEPCAALTAVAPGGSLSADKQISTTDLIGADGVGTGDCHHFAGTSASCPLAAGVIALVLEANPGLSWLELQYVIAEGTEKHNDDHSWIKNGAGKWVSHNYGFGLLNAGLAVEAAKKWGNKKIQERIVTLTNEVWVPISAGRGTSEIQVDDNLSVHHVEVKLWTSHPSVGETTVTLTSPMETKSILAEKHNDRLSIWDGWQFLSRMHWGESIKGKWKLTVEDSGALSHRIDKWILVLYCSSEKSIEPHTIPNLLIPLDTYVEPIPTDTTIDTTTDTIQNPPDIEPVSFEPISFGKVNDGNDLTGVILYSLAIVGSMIIYCFYRWNRYYKTRGGGAAMINL